MRRFVSVPGPLLSSIVSSSELLAPFWASSSSSSKRRVALFVPDARGALACPPPPEGTGEKSKSSPSADPMNFVVARGAKSPGGGCAAARPSSSSSRFRVGRSSSRPRLRAPVPRAGGAAGAGAASGSPSETASHPASPSATRSSCGPSRPHASWTRATRRWSWFGVGSRFGEVQQVETTSARWLES